MNVSRQFGVVALLLSLLLAASPGYCRVDNKLEEINKRLVRADQEEMKKVFRDFHNEIIGSGAKDWDEENAKYALEKIFFYYIQTFSSDSNIWEEMHEDMYKFCNAKTISTMERIFDSYLWDSQGLRTSAMEAFKRLKARWYTPKNAQIRFKCGNKDGNSYIINKTNCEREIKFEITLTNDRLKEIKETDIEKKKFTKSYSVEGEMLKDKSLIIPPETDKRREERTLSVSYEGEDIGSVRVVFISEATQCKAKWPEKKEGDSPYKISAQKVSGDGSAKWFVGEEPQLENNDIFSFTLSPGTHWVKLECQGGGEDKQLFTSLYNTHKYWRWGTTAGCVGAVAFALWSNWKAGDIWEEYESEVPHPEDKYGEYEDQVTMTNIAWGCAVVCAGGAGYLWWKHLGHDRRENKKLREEAEKLKNGISLSLGARSIGIAIPFDVK